METGVDRYKKCVNRENEKCQVVDGISFPGDAERHKQIQNLKIKPDDTFVVCYPKSGTHWLYRIISFLNTEGDLDKATHYPFVPLEVSPPFLPKSPLELIEEAPTPRILTSHLPFELCPKDIQAGKCKVLLVVRNPKDVAVSHFYFHKQLKGLGDFTNLPWADFIEAFCDPSTLPYGSWFSNVKNWLAHRADPNVHVVFYEDLKSNLADGISSLAEFIGRPVSAERAAAIAERANFSGMVKAAKSEAKSERSTSTPLIMRKGIVGDWKSHFTVAQNEMFDQMYQKEMAGIDLSLDYGQ